MMGPGQCTACHAEAQDRNTVGWCNDCHNRAYYARRERERQAQAARREEGRLWWAARGVKPGDRLTRRLHSILGPLYGTRITGVAKVGASGPYIYNAQYGQLDPEGWQKVTA